jgi:hypothetical protein
MKAILALAAAAVLSGCAYYDPYVYNTPYYSAPYAVAPQPYYYDGTLVPYGYPAYGYGYPYGPYGYPNVYPGYPARAGGDRGPRPHSRAGSPPAAPPAAPVARPDGGGSGYPSSRPENPVGGGAEGPTFGGSGSGWVPNQPPVK